MRCNGISRADLVLDELMLAGIDKALGDAPVKEPILAPFAWSGVTHR